MSAINMLDLKAEYAEIEADIRRAIDAVLESQYFIGGPQVGTLEARVGEMLGGVEAVAVSSGTDAILLALMAAEIGHGDEVITTPFTFFATAGCIHRTGAKPVFVDIEPDTFNIDPKQIEAAITERTKAILPVHLFGHCVEMDAIQALADKHGLKVIEDAAQAIGATYRGRSAGILGLAGCFSFYPTKNLGGFGEGGLVVTSDAAFAQRCRCLRNHGQSDQYRHQFVGGNFRLDTMKAAILLVKLDRFAAFAARRQANAAHYNRLLAGVDPIQTPVVRDGCEHAYHQYSILCDRRDALREALSAGGVGSGIYYPLPLHLQPCFAYLGYKPGDFPISEMTAERILSLPVHPMLSEAELSQVTDRIAGFYGVAVTPVAT